MKTYQNPEIEIVIFSTEDIITTSVITTREDELGIMEIDSYN